MSGLACVEHARPLITLKYRRDSAFTGNKEEQQTCDLSQKS